MNDDPISRLAAIDAMSRINDSVCAGQAIDALSELPTIDTVKHGKWIYDDESNTGIYAICSSCGESVYQAGEWLYCPRCGARMDM